MNTIIALDILLSTASRWALKFSLAATLTVNASAQSVYIQGCHEEPVIKAAFDRDGQKPVFIGKRIAIGGVFPGNVITMNENGYGYNLERNPKDDMLCVGAAFRDVQLNHPDNPEIPPWALSIKPNRGIDVRKAYRIENGGRLVLRAVTYVREESGKEVSGKPIVIMAGSKDNKASVWSLDAENSPNTSFDMIEFRIVTNNFNYFLRRESGHSAGKTVRTP